MQSLLIAIRFLTLHKQRFKDPESSAEGIEDESYTDNRVDEEVNESEKNLLVMLFKS